MAARGRPRLRRDSSGAQRVLSTTHIDPHSPPTVTACGTQDDPDSCGRALRFAAALRAAGVPATTIQESGADHMGTLRALIDAKDPLNEALHYFIAKEI